MTLIEAIKSHLPRSHHFSPLRAPKPAATAHSPPADRQTPVPDTDSTALPASSPILPAPAFSPAHLLANHHSTSTVALNSTPVIGNSNLDDIPSPADSVVKQKLLSQPVDEIKLKEIAPELEMPIVTSDQELPAQERSMLPDLLDHQESEPTALSLESEQSPTKTLNETILTQPDDKSPALLEFHPALEITQIDPSLEIMQEDNHIEIPKSDPLLAQGQPSITEDSEIAIIKPVQEIELSPAQLDPINPVDAFKPTSFDDPERAAIIKAELLSPEPDKQNLPNPTPITEQQKLKPKKKKLLEFITNSPLKSKKKSPSDLDQSTHSRRKSQIAIGDKLKGVLEQVKGKVKKDDDAVNFGKALSKGELGV
ncbi:hypothetical protein O181_002915 [Austropuccinia psidii MF-1]|uniref:Uncharacterized protein n=1 Tax=Austropuccinia psidii MF-1 TaxID=1389203 RepID=A0A9Q3BDY2_9BASI|nr:hypothetical protein [Austropuccinia psidii MF-1]